MIFRQCSFFEIVFTQLCTPNRYTPLKKDRHFRNHEASPINTRTFNGSISTQNPTIYQQQKHSTKTTCQRENSARVSPKGKSQFGRFGKFEKARFIMCTHAEHTSDTQTHMFAYVVRVPVYMCCVHNVCRTAASVLRQVTKGFPFAMRRKVSPLWYGRSKYVCVDMFFFFF